MPALATLRAHQGLRRRLLAQAAVPGARSPDAGRRSRARCFGFLGPNGAGKTTTLKLLMQLVFPTSGTRRSPRQAGRRPLGETSGSAFLPENPYFYDYLTAEELLEYFAGLFGYRGAGAPASRKPAARRGRRRRRAAAAAPEVLEGHAPARRHRAGARQRSRSSSFFDEPMSGLDPLGRRDVRTLILKLRDQGRTVFFSSHVLSDAEALCSRVAILAPWPPRRGRGASPICWRSDPRLGGRPLACRRRHSESAGSSGRPAARAFERGPLHRRVAARSPTRSRSSPRYRRRARASSRVNPIRQTLEDFFVQQVTSPQDRRSRAASVKMCREDLRESHRDHCPERLSRVGATTRCSTTSCSSRYC